LFVGCSANTKDTETMGQAKRRGTFEERRKQSIDAANAARTEREREEAEWWNSLTDEEKRLVRRNRERRARQMQALAMWMGAAHGLGGRF
jgi:hypothetical protein